MNSRLHLYARFVAFGTLCLIFVGGLVTSTGSGLSVPDWPLSFGKFFPEMKGGVFFEHGHRMVAGTVVILTSILVAWILKTEKRSWVRGLAIFSIVAILLQALLGGLTVLMKLPPAVSVAHAGLAQAFFCSVVCMAIVTSETWNSKSAEILDSGIPSLQTLTLLTTGLIYLQILLGAVMRHVGAGLAIPDFPLSFGYIIPPHAFFTYPVAIHYAHRVGALVVSIFVLWTATRVFSLKTHFEPLRRLAGFGLAVLALQVTLGGITVLSGKAVVPTTFHVAVGALLLAIHVALTLWTRHVCKLTHASLTPNLLST